MIFDKKNLGGWSLSEKVLVWIYENLPHGSTILELGSGNGTKELVKYYNVISVEENKNWIGVSPQSKYIYAPMKEYSFANKHSCCWYDDDYLTDFPTHYHLLIIDGPVGNNRTNFIHFYNMFKKNIPYIIDDTNRGGDKELSTKLAEILNKTSFEIDGDGKLTTILL